MNTYRIPYNQHPFKSNTDTPRSATRIIKAPTPDDALEIMHQWRAENPNGITTRAGGGYWIGMIFEPEEIT